MMYECELAEDLLPLYIENMLGETARQFVQQHLQQCPECKHLYQQLIKQDQQVVPDKLLTQEKQKAVHIIVRGYRRWLYSLLAIAVFCSLLGGIGGTYLTMKYEELVPTRVAQDFIKYALPGDRWIYQERVSQEFKDSISMDSYQDISTWEQMEAVSSKVNPTGLKIYKRVTAQEYGPFDVPLQVGLVLEKGGFRVFRVSIIGKDKYLEQKAKLEQAIGSSKQGSAGNISKDDQAIKELDKQYVSIPPANPVQGEYFIEGRILSITDKQIIIEQHLDTHSVPVEKIKVTRDTVIARHHIVGETDYYRKIPLEELKVGDVIFAIFTKDNVPRLVALAN